MENSALEQDLLPINATALERSLALASARLHGVPTRINLLWDPQSCPETLLPWLAWALSVDFWQEKWALEQKRSAIAESVSVHAHRGTRKAISDAIVKVLKLHSKNDGDSDPAPDFSNAFTITEWWEQADELQDKSQQGSSTAAATSKPEPLTFRVKLSHPDFQGRELQLQGQLYNDLIQAINAVKPLTTRFRLEVGDLEFKSELHFAGGITVMQMARFTAAVKNSEN